MGTFPERVIQEFPAIIKRNTFTKEVKYRIRLVNRVDTRMGITRLQLDIRAHITTEKFSTLTSEGIYLTWEEFNILYDIMTDIKKQKFFERIKDGTEL